MFDHLKPDIRKEINYVTVENIQDETAGKLQTIAKKAKDEKNFEKFIACEEMILEDLGMDNPNAFGQKTALLSEYNDCGYYNSEEARNLALNLLKETSKTNAVLPQVYIPAIRPLYCSGNAEYKQLAKQCAESAFNVGKKLAQQNNDDISKQTVCLSFRELMRIYFKEGKYSEADNLFFTAQDILKTDPVVMCLDTILSFYDLTEGDFSEQALQFLQNLNNIPEANYILGIAYAEGYKVPRDVNAAKSYFEKGNQWAASYKGSTGYTNYEFSVLSDLSQEEVLETARIEAYHSKFFLQRQKDKNTQKSASEKTPEKKSGGCYVATCVYGSYDCPPVWTLRRFRDDVLAQNPFGRSFIRLYYAVSPWAVKRFGKYNWFHKLFKMPLDTFVKKLQQTGIQNTPYND